MENPYQRGENNEQRVKVTKSEVFRTSKNHHPNRRTSRILLTTIKLLRLIW